MSQNYIGLQGQIRYVEDNIAIKGKLGKDYSFSGNRNKALAEAPESKSRGIKP